MFILLYSYRRYFGIVISHYQVALYSARRDEMVEMVQATLFYMNPDAPIPVHSPYSALPYEVRNCLTFEHFCYELDFISRCAYFSLFRQIGIITCISF